MRFALLAVLLATGCRIDLDKREVVDADIDVGRACKTSATIQVCLDAASHSDFDWIQSNIFSTNCSGDSCHGKPSNGSPPSGRLILARGEAYATLLGTGSGVMSNIDPNHKLVVPGSPESSYLQYIIKDLDEDAASPAFTVPPDDIGFMPMSNNTLCCQKIDAISRWIAAGAPGPTM